jgi:hypothetical protein
MKKRDWLEVYVENHRSEWDDLSAPERIWNGIEHKLDKKQKGTRFITLSLWKMAAIFLSVLVGGAMMGKYYFSNSTTGIDPAYATEMRMVEDHYSREVSLKINEAKQHNLIDTDVANDLGQLDKVYLELKSEMMSKKDINNKELMTEMINNYRIRLSLLETLLERHRRYEDEKTHTIY